MQEGEAQQLDLDTAKSTADCVYLEEITSQYIFYIQIVAVSALNVHIVAGNLLVILAVYTYRKLRQNKTNAFIVSLAFSDFLLGIAVMPFTSTFFLLNKHWIFGTSYCRVWLAVDVWLCTASILNLVAISYERYLAIKKPMSYGRVMTSRRIRVLLVGVWILALMISIPGFITNDGSPKSRSDLLSVNQSDPRNLTMTLPLAMSLPSLFDAVNDSKCTQRIDCSISESSPIYIVYSSSGSFFLPAAVMLAFYVEIYKTARRTLHAMHTGRLLTKGHDSKDVVVLRVHIGGYAINGSQSRYIRAGADDPDDTDDPRVTSHHVPGSENGDDKPPREAAMAKGTFTPDAVSDLFTDLPLAAAQPTSNDNERNQNHGRCVSDKDAPYEYVAQHAPSATRFNAKKQPPKKQTSLSTTQSALGSQTSRTNRETKAAKTVAIICGSFLLCWLGFFCAYLLSAFCDRCVPDLVWDILFWLGYTNSACNPCVYALFSRDFRTGFSRLLRGVCCWRASKRKRFNRELALSQSRQQTRRFNTVYAHSQSTRNHNRCQRPSTAQNPLDDRLIDLHAPCEL